ncbi:glycosyltransferase family 4 protein [Fibrobacter sp.]|uniref:glycosyltransferase family 4 protein n=1 Tax=Fibrobacter sp. TaxID=35828 RepID=UPI00386F137D
MKILWFANTPCEAEEKLTGKPVTGGGWLYALSQEMKKNPQVELHIAFYWGVPMEPFLYSGIYYHPVLRSGNGSKIGRYIYRLRSQFSDCYDAVEIPRLLDVVSSTNPDVIHIHGSEENFGLIAEHIDSRKICMSVQGILGPYKNKYFSGIPKEVVEKNSPFIKRLLLDDSIASFRRFCRKTSREKRIYRKIDNIIGRTKWDEMCSLALNPERKYYTCNEILRSDFFKKEWAPTSNEKFKIVSTISFGLWKGVEVIFQAAKILEEAGFNFEWNVIGITANDEKALYSEKMTSFNRDSLNVKFLGRMDSSRLIEQMMSSNLFVQVSRIENSPNTLCEAMLLGMPIIASYVGGTASMMKEGIEGNMYQEGEPYVLAGLIMDCEKNYAKYVEMGKNARAHALKRHNPQNVAQELKRIYESICLSNERVNDMRV